MELYSFCVNGTLNVWLPVDKALAVFVWASWTFIASYTFLPAGTEHNCANFCPGYAVPKKVSAPGIADDEEEDDEEEDDEDDPAPPTTAERCAAAAAAAGAAAARFFAVRAANHLGLLWEAAYVCLYVYSDAKIQKIWVTRNSWIQKEDKNSPWQWLRHSLQSEAGMSHT